MWKSCVQVVLILLSCLSASSAIAQSGSTTLFDDEPGLLGRHFLEGQFILLRTPSEFRSIDSSMTGFSTALNVPAPWNDFLPETIGQDVFASALGLNFGGFGSFDGNIFEMNAELRSASAGINTYLYLTNDIRPFVQLGVISEVSTVSLEGWGFSFDETDLDSRLLVNPGIELDLTDQLAMRTTFDLDTKGSFEDALYRVELIAWPTSWLYLRGGVMGDIEGETVGGLVGAGIAW